jgi:3-hydroxymyristoyl/3-hydroxydecanoyl-(acyl carrier protein) dehydratase
VSFQISEAAAVQAVDAVARVQAVVNAGNFVPDTDIDSRLAVEAFLGVPLPSDEDLFGGEALRFLRQTDMEALMLERAPFFFIERAVAIGTHTVLGLAPMTVERSAGHFPGKPVVPLIELCKAMAQAGIVLASLQALPHEAPIAIGSGESKALAKELILAPVDVLVAVRLKASRLGLHIVEGSAYVGGKKIGTLAKIVYTLLPRDQLTG